MNVDVLSTVGACVQDGVTFWGFPPEACVADRPSGSTLARGDAVGGEERPMEHDVADAEAPQQPSTVRSAVERPQSAQRALGDWRRERRVAAGPLARRLRRVLEVHAAEVALGPEHRDV